MTRSTNLKDLTQDKRDLFIKNVFSTVAPHIDPLDTGFSLGLCHRWRRKVASGVQRGDRVLDVCTGTGELALQLLKKVGSEGSVTGVDFCEEMLDLARKKISHSCGNITLVQGDARDLAFGDSSFDAVTISFGMRNIPDALRALREMRRVLKPGGKFMCLELTKPSRAWFRRLHTFYTFQIMPRIAQFIIKSDTPYTYLPRSIDSFYLPEEFKDLIEQAGFSDVQVLSLSFGAATIFQAVKR